MQRLIYTLLLIAAASISKAVVTFTITNTGTGSAGCADVVLSQAQTQANLGNDVIVYMDAPGFCAPAIVLSLTSGSLTIQKKPGAAVAQGFDWSINASGSGYALNITCQSSLTAITVKDITVQYFAGVISLTGGKSCLIDNCIFKGYNYYPAIYFVDLNNGSNSHVIKDVTVQNCTFSGRFTTIAWYDPQGSTICRKNYYFTSTAAKTFKVLNNTFKTLASAGCGGPNWCINGSFFIEDIIDISTYAGTDNLSIEIKNNSSPQAQGSFATRIGASPTTYPFVGSYMNNDYLFSVDIQNNSQMSHIFLDRPLSYWKIQNNSIIPCASYIGQSGIVVSPNYPGGTSSTLYTTQKLGFINSNSVYCNNQTYINSNNTFNNAIALPNYYAPAARTWATIVGNKSPGCALTEILDITNMSGSIRIYDNVSVRRCKIAGTQYSVQPNGFTTVPIIAMNNPMTATLGLTSIVSGSVVANYTYTGISNASNNDLYIDFYKSNANGDLVDYLGEKLIPVGSISGSGTASITIPGTVTLNGSDRIAITLTGLNPNPATYPTVVSFGTSYVFYPMDLTPCTSASFNAPLTACAYPSGVAVTANLCANTQAVYTWNMYDPNGSPLVGYGFSGPNITIPSYIQGTYTLKLTVNYPGQTAPQTAYQTIVINNSCAPPPPPPNSTPCCNPSPSLTMVNPPTQICAGEPITFNFAGSVCSSSSDIYINMGECQWYPLYSGSSFTITKTIVHTYNQPGNYTIITGGPNSMCYYTLTNITVLDCDDGGGNEAPNCQPNFSPPPGDYILSFWVREELSTYANLLTYSSGMHVNYMLNNANNTIQVYADDPNNAQNRMIDRWQKVEQKITIPPNSTDIKLSLVNRANNSSNAYFDDIRFHPFNSSFKSYVYDPVTLRLSAELDERNYATFYEYDEEGQLIRIKKETERGVKTIKESRTSVSK